MKNFPSTPGIRIAQGTLSSYEEDGLSGAFTYAYEGSKNAALIGGTAITIMSFPSAFTQLRYLPLLLRGGMQGRTALGIYGGNLLPFPSLAGIGVGLLSNYLQSIGQDGKPGVPTPPVPPRTPIGTKPSKPTSSGSTSKPFWSSGKPKCKKGFRYDFKRKLCVKIK